MKLHRKRKHNEKVCHAHDLGSYAQGEGRRSKSWLSNNSKTTEANLTKLHRKIEYNEKVCHAQELGSYAQGAPEATSGGILKSHRPSVRQSVRPLQIVSQRYLINY